MNDNELAAYNAHELIDVSELAREVGYPPHLVTPNGAMILSIAITPRVYMNWGYWTDADSDKQIIQLQEERIWNILYHAFMAIQNKKDAFKMKVIPRDEVSKTPIEIDLRVMITGFMNKPNEIVIVIQEPDENITSWSNNK